MQEPPPFSGYPDPSKPPILGGVPSRPQPPVLGKHAPSAPPPLPKARPAPPPLPIQPPRSTATQPPKEFKQVRSSNRGLKIGLIIAVACILLVCVLGIAITLANRASGGYGSSGAFFTRKDTAEDFAFLCEALLDKIKLVGGVEPSDAEVIVLNRNRRDNFVRISAKGAELGRIAQSILGESGKADEVLTNLPNGRAFFSGAGDVITGLNSNSSDQVRSGLGKALPELLRGMETYDKIVESLNFRHGVAINLVKLSPKFSGSSTNSAALSYAFTEHLPGLFELETVQSLSLNNSSGRDLHNCVILVRLSDADGKSYANVHFAPLWPQAGQLLARYTDTDATAKTLADVTNVEITVWAREHSFEPKILTRPREGWPDIQ